ncbi:MAG: NUDIX hydrolase [Pseudomonadales bacterium]
MKNPIARQQRDLYATRADFMHRRQILALIDRYEQQFPDEHEEVRRIRAFVQSHEDCFERSLAPGHVTGSAWLLDDNRERVLLTHHRKLDIWVQLGGHADGEANISLVARKEAQEESGLKDLELLSDQIFDIDIHAIPERGAEPSHYHYDCRFLFRAAGAQDYVVSDESHDLAWIPLDKVCDYTTEASIMRMLEKTRQGLIK